MCAEQITISPIDDSVYVKRDYADKATIDSTLDRARAAQKQWKTCPLAERKALCSKAVDAFVEHYAASREWEEREFRKHITDWEMERYFEII